MLTIHLENDTLYLYGSPEESAGTEIRGCLELLFKEKTRIKSISLQFVGVLKQSRSEGSVYQRRHGKLKKSIFQHDWTFLPGKNCPHTINANTTYRYPFDLVLPGNIAESITSDACGGLGSLTYEFKATVTRPFATKNLVVHRPIQIIRCQSLSLDNGLYGMDGANSRVISKTFGDKIKYRIKLETDQYQRCQPIRIHFTFNPLLQDIRVKYISCFLKEYTTLTPFDDDSTTQPLSHQHSQIISLVRDDRFPCQGVKWENTEMVVVPRSTQLDVDHPWIRIEHKLRLTVCFVQQSGQLSELRVTIPIKILDQLTAPISTTNHLFLENLPRYEEACLSTPYDPQHRFWSSSPSPSPSLDSNNYTLSSYNDEDDDNWQHQPMTTTPRESSDYIGLSCDYFSYQPSNHLVYLQRAPSYSTVIRI